MVKLSQTKPQFANRCRS